MAKKRKTTRKSKQAKTLNERKLLQFLVNQEKAMRTREVSEAFHVTTKAGREKVYELLQRLERKDKLIQLSKHRWAAKHALEEYVGRVVGHVEGHGYVLTEEDNQRVFLRSHEMREVLHNDIVKVRVVGRDRRQRMLGRIVEVVEHGNAVLVGRYYEDGQIGFVVPEDQRIGQDVFIHPRDKNGAAHEQVVSVRITKPPSKHFQPVGEVLEVLGEYLAPGMEIEIAIRKHQLPHTWSDLVAKEADKLKEQPIDLYKGERRDMRDLAFVTIDGADARDFDDAVYAKRNKQGGWQLYVAIADVSAYVAIDSAIDKEAWHRGNSVYFPDHVIPMLPEVLSNDLCSLRPKEDRLAFVCQMHIDEGGNIVDYQFFRANIHSHARLTYDMVARNIEGDHTDSELKNLGKEIQELRTLTDCLRQRRRDLGFLELDIDEAQIHFDQNRKIKSIGKRPRNIAHTLIEECMLAANICASLFLEDAPLEAIFRVHEAPDEDRVDNLRRLLRQFKQLLPAKAGTPEFAKVAAKVDNPLDRKIAHTAILRSLKQARYSVENTGHFALNFDSYTHFTSPIRRYADLVVHRQLAAALDPKPNAYQHEFLQNTCVQVSRTERLADAATREVTQWLKCEYMQLRVGETFEAFVTSVTDFGLFVELRKLFVDGLVHITALPSDYYRYDEERQRLLGENSGRSYQLGQRLQVKLARVDMQQARIDFVLNDQEQNKKPRRRRKRR